MANAPRDQNRVPTLLGVSSTGFLIPTTVAVNPSTHAMLVESTFSPSGTQDVNLTQIGGVATSVGNGTTDTGTLRVTISSDSTGQIAIASLPNEGQQTMANSISIAIASNQSAVPVTLTSTTITGTVAVTQSTSPWIVAGGGAAGSAATGVVTVQGIASMTPVQVSQATASNLNATVVQATGTNLHTVVDSGTITTITNTVTVSGSVTANAGTNLNTSALLTTAAHDAAFGTAGSADAQVRSIQGIASMTPVQVSQATASNLNAQVVGSIADDSAASGNPVITGGIAKSPDGTDPSSVTENDAARHASDLNRRQYVNIEHPAWGSFHSDGTSALTDQSVAADPGDGFQIVITEIIVSTGAATAMNVFFEEGSTKILGPWYLEAVAGRGVYWQGHKHVTASTAVTVTTSAAIAQSIDVQYYIQAV